MMWLTNIFVTWIMIQVHSGYSFTPIISAGHNYLRSHFLLEMSESKDTIKLKLVSKAFPVKSSNKLNKANENMLVSKIYSKRNTPNFERTNRVDGMVKWIRELFISRSQLSSVGNKISVINETVSGIESVPDHLKSKSQINNIQLIIELAKELLYSGE